MKCLCLFVAVLVVASAVASTSAQAERVYQYRDTKGRVLFTDKSYMPQQYHLVSVRQYGWTFDSSPLTDVQRDRYDGDIRLAAERFSVKPSLIKAVMHAESHFNRFAISRAGAKGLMQLMPATAASLDISDVFDARQNILGGAELLSFLKQQFASLDEVLAAYNAGASNVLHYGGIPPFPETIRYVEKVKELLPRYRRQFSKEQLSQR
jgi:soluble lytic murein transglycosylase-like protein